MSTKYTVTGRGKQIIKYYITHIKYTVKRQIHFAAYWGQHVLHLTTVLTCHSKWHKKKKSTESRKQKALKLVWCCCFWHFLTFMMFCFVFSSSQGFHQQSDGKRSIQALHLWTGAQTPLVRNTVNKHMLTQTCNINTDNDVQSEVLMGNLCVCCVLGLQGTRPSARTSMSQWADRLERTSLRASGGWVVPLQQTGRVPALLYDQD